MYAGGPMRLVFANGVWVEVMCIISEHKFLRSGCAFSNVLFTFHQLEAKISQGLGAGRPTR